MLHKITTVVSLILLLLLHLGADIYNLVPNSQPNPTEVPLLPFRLDMQSVICRNICANVFSFHQKYNMVLNGHQ